MKLIRESTSMIVEFAGCQIQQASPTTEVAPLNCTGAGPVGLEARIASANPP